ncbi:MAG: hypothetical protein AAGA26_01620 [Pseudomonadota bacterium]
MKKPVSEAPKELDSSDLDFAVGAGFGSAFLAKRPWGEMTTKEEDWEIDENDLDDLDDV